jgi:hypothetical protein
VAHHTDGDRARDLGGKLRPTSCTELCGSGCYLPRDEILIAAFAMMPAVGSLNMRNIIRLRHNGVGARPRGDNSNHDPGKQDDRHAQ